MKHPNRTSPQEDPDERGFVALLTVIVLGSLLMAAVARASLTGQLARTHALDAEAHGQARALADGCAVVAMTRVLTDPAYGGGTTDVSSSGSCTVLPIGFDVPSPGMVTVMTQGVVRGFYADVAVVFASRAVCTASSPLSSGLTIESWNEVPSHE